MTVSAESTFEYIHIYIYICAARYLIRGKHHLHVSVAHKIYLELNITPTRATSICDERCMCAALLVNIYMCLCVLCAEWPRWPVNAVWCNRMIIVTGDPAVSLYLVKNHFRQKRKLEARARCADRNARAAHTHTHIRTPNPCLYFN